MCQQLLVKQSNIKICENLFSSSQVDRHDKANRHTSAAFKLLMHLNMKQDIVYAGFWFESEN